MIITKDELLTRQVLARQIFLILILISSPTLAQKIVLTDVGEASDGEVGDDFGNSVAYIEDFNLV